MAVNCPSVCNFMVAMATEGGGAGTLSTLTRQKLEGWWSVTMWGMCVLFCNIDSLGVKMYMKFFCQA